MLTSQSEQKTKEYEGLVYSKKAPKNIRAGCKINFNIDTVNVRYGINLYSPMVTGFEIMKYGSNQLRKKLHYIPELDMSKARLLEPITKGKGFKSRSSKSVKYTQPKNATRNLLKKKTVKLDDPKNIKY